LFRKDPTAYKGHVGDVAMVLRIALTGRTNTPDLYEIMQIMGKSRVIERLERYMHAPMQGITEIIAGNGPDV